MLLCKGIISSRYSVILQNVFWLGFEPSNTLWGVCAYALSTLAKKGLCNELVSIGCAQKAGMVAHPVTEVIGEQALVDILDLSEVAWTGWGCFYTQQWAGAEDGEAIRPAAGTGNE